MNKKIAIIIGAGPAGLTAAYELLTRTDIQPVIVEATADIGGIAKTVNYKGNRIDIGGHRFFSKSDRIMNWWGKIFALQNYPEQTGQSDKIMFVRQRLSRILFGRKLFPYPVKLSWSVAKDLGWVRLIKIMIYYLGARLFPIKPEKSLEDFFINRFGRELYEVFFKDYTEKVWGVPCRLLKPEWGAQRVKGLSLTAALRQAVKNFLRPGDSLEQKKTETSLIEKFLYPKFGPGQFWTEVAEIIISKGGVIKFNTQAVQIAIAENKIVKVVVQDTHTKKEEILSGDYFFSSMPVKDLISAMGENAPEEVKKVAVGLKYRDFITVGILAQKLEITGGQGRLLLDNWIYIQEPDLKMGRLQIFNNWSPYLVKNKDNFWLGLEYFCNEGDEFWNKSDENIKNFAVQELEKINFLQQSEVLDAVVIRLEKTYPAYFGSYEKFYVIRDFTDKIENLFLIGRNGMHRYNNQDHSMLTAMVAVDNIIAGVTAKDNIWAVNAEKDYHEEYVKK